MGQFWSAFPLETPHNVKENYAITKVLGEGAFGKVYKVLDKSTRNVFALKVIKCDSNESLERVDGEMRALSNLNHAHIMKLIETNCVQLGPFKAELHLVFEFCSGGTLNQRLAQVNDNKNNLKWMRQLADGVAYLHSRHLVHRDLKPDNILFNNNQDVKIGDFGLARDFHAHSTDQGQSLHSYYILYGCGTFSYMAPEIFNDRYNEKADIFSLGILLYAIEERTCVVVNGKKYYGMFLQCNGNDVPLGYQMFQQGNGHLTIPFNNTSKNLAQIIGSALLFDQKRRPSAQTIKQQLNNNRM